MSGILYCKSKRVLRFLIHQNDEIKFAGDLFLDLDNNKIKRLESEGLEHPLSPKDALRLLKKVHILVSSDRRTLSVFEKVRDFFDEHLNYTIESLCPLCIGKGRIKHLKTPYEYLGRQICRDCCVAEVRKELRFRGLSNRTIDFLQPQVDRLRDYEKVINLFSRKYGPTDPGVTLYDREEITEEGRPRPLDQIPIDPAFMDLLKERGVRELLPVQSLALDNGLLDGKDLLVVSATASGKTLIAELAGVSSALKGSKFLYLVPLVALANQKYHDFRAYKKLGLRTSIRVGMSRIKEKGELVVQDMDIRSSDIVVGTYEGIDKVLRSGRSKDLGEVGCIVIDEIHMLNEDERGPEIDGLMARLRYTFPNAQFIALSATVGNPGELAGDLELIPVLYDKRPTTLERHLVFARNEHDKLGIMAKLVKEERNTQFRSGYKGQTIVFTNSRRKTESMASYLKKRGIKAAAYHAGLSYSKRKKTETAFLKQKIAAVIATSALGAGVDLPASQVIFETLAMGNREISVGEFHQMLGRAGRPMYHDRGKVCLLVELGGSSITRQKEEDAAFRLLRGRIEDVAVTAGSDEALEQLLANGASAGVAGLNAVTEKMLLEIDVEEGREALGSMELMDEKGPTELGSLASLGFLKPSHADHIRKNIKTAPLDILIHLYPFENAYLVDGLKLRLEEVYRTRISARYFDGVGIVFEEPKEEFKDLLESVTLDLMNCRCPGFPYCDHGITELSRMIIEFRREGLSVMGIAASLRAYRMDVYPGDIFSWLDGIIRKCETLESIYWLFGEDGLMKGARILRKNLERPDKKNIIN